MQGRLVCSALPVSLLPGKRLQVSASGSSNDTAGASSRRGRGSAECMEQNADCVCICTVIACVSWDPMRCTVAGLAC